MKVSVQPFGKIPTGELIKLFTLSNDSGFSFSVINYGAIITEVIAPGSNGVSENVVLGFDTLDEYLNFHHCFGAICGRYAGRIKHGKFKVGGATYQLPINDGVNTLHGGGIGFDKKVWSETVGPDFVEMSHVSVDGEQDFPGEMHITVKYSITEQNEIIIDYKAICDKPTVLNLTNHSYFNLSGCNEDILSHKLKIDASSYTPSDDAFIPTGEVLPLFDAINFTKSRLLGDTIHEVNGFNHNFVLNRNGVMPELVAELSHDKSGRKISMFTTEPALMVYSANYLPLVMGKDGKSYNKYYGLCLEAQHYPDSPNNPNFPSTELHPGDVYTQTTVYKFDVI